MKRRADERVPVALLTGRREFWSLPLRVTPEVGYPETSEMRGGGPSRAGWYNAPYPLSEEHYLEFKGLIEEILQSLKQQIVLKELR